MQMGYYFKPKTGEFIDSTADINNPDYVGLSEAQYHISRLVVRGYNREQIEIAVDILFNTIESAQQSVQRTPLWRCANCGAENIHDNANCSVCGKSGRR